MNNDLLHLLFFVVGVLCSVPMQWLIQHLPASLLTSDADSPPTPETTAEPTADLTPGPTPGPLPTPWPSPLLALLNGVVWAGCAWHWPEPTTAACWAMFASGLIALSIIDWQTTLLPDALTQPLLWLGLLCSASQSIVTPLDQAVWGAAIGYAALWSVAFVFTRLSGKEGMGGGDFKLFAALGAWLGPWALLPLIFLASLVGALVGLWLQARQRLHQGVYVPFGPFLAGAGLLLAVLGHDWFFH